MELPLMKTRPALALAEEHEIAREALYALLPRFPAEAFTTGDPKTEDNVRGILCHVTFAMFSYSCWMRRVLGRLDPAVEKEQKTAFLSRVEGVGSGAGFAEASLWAASHLYDTLAGLEAEELGREFKSNWGETIAVETMIEHALVHLLRHRRQLQIHLGDRERGKVLGE